MSRPADLELAALTKFRGIQAEAMLPEVCLDSFRQRITLLL